MQKFATFFYYILNISPTISVLSTNHSTTSYSQTQHKSTRLPSNVNPQCFFLFAYLRPPPLSTNTTHHTNCEPPHPPTLVTCFYLPISPSCQPHLNPPYFPQSVRRSLPLSAIHQRTQRFICSVSPPKTHSRPRLHPLVVHHLNHTRCPSTFPLLSLQR